MIRDEPAIRDLDRLFARPIPIAMMAIGLGVIIDTVALHSPPGIGLAVGLVAGIVAIGGTNYLLNRQRPSALLLVSILGTTVAGFIAIRASAALQTFNVFGSLVAMIILSQLAQRRGDVATWSLKRYLDQPFHMVSDIVLGAGRFVGIELRERARSTRSDRIRAIIVGLILGLPFVVLFGGLFAAADGRFEALVDRLFNAPDDLVGRLVGSFAIGLAVVGVWRSARESKEERTPPPARRRLEVASGITVLISLVAVFSLFVITQVVADRPELVESADFSSNAREGFFELVAVTALVVAVLLLFDWLTRSEEGERSAAFDRLAVTLIALTGVVMLSALNRMRLYVEANGLTELRLYTTIFMLWIGFILVWFARTVLANKHARFAYGMVVSGFAVIIAMNIVNPDARITQINADRYLVGVGFDQQYVTGLSFDAVPQMIRTLTLDESLDTCVIERHLALVEVRLREEAGVNGFLGDSWSAWRARSALTDLDIKFDRGRACAIAVPQRP